MSSRAVHVVLECSGHRAAIEAGFSQLARGGILVMVGAGIDHPTFDINRMILNELTVTGSFVYDLGGFERGARAARPRTGSRPTSSSNPTTSRSTGSSTPSRRWRSAASPAR